jgi:hypothetical protein
VVAAVGPVVDELPPPDAVLEAKGAAVLCLKKKYWGVSCCVY